MELTHAEEQVMKYLWRLEKAYMKNILDQFPEPRPAASTVATLLKRMIDKGFVGYSQHGSNREYIPLVRKSVYFSGQVNVMIRDFFNDSAAQFASFFTHETDLSVAELEELKKVIDRQIKTRKKPD